MSQSQQVVTDLQTHKLLRAILQKPTTALPPDYHPTPRSQRSPAEGHPAFFLLPALSLSSLPPLLPIFHFLPNVRFPPLLSNVFFTSELLSFPAYPQPDSQCLTKDVVTSLGWQMWGVREKPTFQMQAHSGCRWNI